MDKHSIFSFPPEWHPQDAILVIWPNENTDWKVNLDEVKTTYKEIVKVVSEYQKVIIICHNEQLVKKELNKCNLNNVICIYAEYNDTWVRDSGPITIYENNYPVLLDFGFNGWGGKYDAKLDNQITKKLFSTGIFQKKVDYRNCFDFILEGGSIDTDGKGTLLTTESCLLSNSRNSGLPKQEIDKILIKYLGLEQIHWLKYGKIIGDDTDGHIDTLAKFCNETTIAYCSCIDKNDIHYKELKNMQYELSQLKNLNKIEYNLVDLPLPKPIYRNKISRLPATYVNFLITNNAILLPSYKDKMDHVVKEKLEAIFNDKAVVLIDCLSLIQQNGSLHCITMQLPKGALKNT